MTWQEFYASPDLADGFGAEGAHRKNPHRGLDLPHSWGTPIPSLGGGTVTISEYNSALGWIVEVTGDDGLYPGYRHQSGQGLPIGTRVEAGDVIGHVGDTSTASAETHLCLTIGTAPGAVYGVPSLVTDPWPYLQTILTTPSPPKEDDPMPTIYARATKNSTPLTPGNEGTSRVWAGDDRKTQGATYSGVWAIDTDTGTARRLTMAEWRIVQGAYATAGKPVPVADVHGNDLEVLLYAPTVKP